MDKIFIQRLSFIKYLFSIGYHQSQQPAPLYGAAILSFHDSIELFLQLSSEKLNISKQIHNFIDYWDAIDGKLNGCSLSQKESMRRLNKARVNLKHHGIIPSQLDIETFRVTTAAFFNENCLAIFQIDFDKISLIDIIKFDRSRELLRKAKEDFEKNKIIEALQGITLSFHYLLSDYENSKMDSFHDSPFFFGKKMTFLSSFHIGIGLDGKMKDFVDAVKDSIEAMQKAVKILSFGIDYKKYAKFQSISLPVQFTMNGKAHFYIRGVESLDSDTMKFCENFIIEAALKLQEFDFELIKYDNKHRTKNQSTGSTLPPGDL